jgi:hypothetical protein
MERLSTVDLQGLTSLDQLLLIMPTLFNFYKAMLVNKEHRHLSNKDCLKACTTCLVGFIITVNDHHKEKKKKP